MHKKITRMQRYRKTAAIRSLLAENKISIDDLVLPMFIREDIEVETPIASLPEISQFPLNLVEKEIKEIDKLGIKAVILFGIPKSKDDVGTEAFNSEGVVQKAIKIIKEKYPEMIVIVDCCLCEYTDHGHCGIMKDGNLDNDATLLRLEDIAVSYAVAGADIIAPSGMMDGMVASIRSALDKAGFVGVSIMSYSAKYASSFYGPFRDAAGSGENFKGDRKHHQMAMSQRSEAIAEAEADIAEGADYLMVKPGMPYLDIVRDLKNMSTLPIVVYQVSGEYAMLKQAAQVGIVDEERAFEESLLAFKRAGATLIISYYTKKFAQKYNR